MEYKSFSDLQQQHPWAKRYNGASLQEEQRPAPLVWGVCKAIYMDLRYAAERADYNMHLARIRSMPVGADGKAGTQRQ